MPCRQPPLYRHARVKPGHDDRRNGIEGVTALTDILTGFALLALVSSARAEDLRPYAIVGNAIPQSLTGAPGDAARGKAIVVNRQVGLCLLCHSGPFPEEKFQGNLAPSLAGAGSRWTVPELRLRIVDARRLNPDTIMPSYYRTQGLTRVAPAVAGKPLLTAEQIEDVVAYLATLKE